MNALSAGISATCTQQSTTRPPTDGPSEVVLAVDVQVKDLALVLKKGLHELFRCVVGKPIDIDERTRV